KILDRGAFDLKRALELDPHFLCDDEHGHHHHDHHDDHDHDHHGHDHHHHDHGHDHHHDHAASPIHDTDIHSVSLATDTPLDPQKFDAWIGEVLMTDGQRILRTKGILNMQGADERFVFQAVHMVSEGVYAGPWPSKDNRRSRLVFIGRELDEAALKAGFE